MSTELSTRVAIVTGGSRGIGRGIVRRLAAQGYAVVVSYASNADEAAAAVKEAAEAGAEATAFQADVADEVAVADMFAEAESRFGGVDVVVHAAGRMLLGTIEQTDLDEFDALFRTNVRGSFVVAQQAARHAREGGSIQLFSSEATGASLPGYGVYTATKAAVEAMTLILARELRGRNVTVNTIAPGLTATDMLLENQTEESLAEGAAAAPLERLGEVAGIAAVAEFLASPEGHWVNGQTVHANGGLV
jgi:3-oxoacyl-[acyl-carrier protein] reductase